MNSTPSLTLPAQPPSRPPTSRATPRNAAKRRANLRTEAKAMLFAMFRAHRFQQENRHVHNPSQNTMSDAPPGPHPNREDCAAKPKWPIFECARTLTHFPSRCGDARTKARSIHMVFPAPPSGYPKKLRSTKHRIYGVVSCMCDVLCASDSLFLASAGRTDATRRSKKSRRGRKGIREDLQERAQNNAHRVLSCKSLHQDNAIRI